MICNFLFFYFFNVILCYIRFSSYIYNHLRLGFLSINRFERKKNIGLAISAFAKLGTLEGGILQDCNAADVSLIIAGKSQLFSLVLLYLVGVK